MEAPLLLDEDETAPRILNLLYTSIATAYEEVIALV